MSFKKYLKKNGPLKNNQEVYDVIEEAVRRMPHHSRALEAWRLNCGRSTSRTHGFLRMLTQIRVLKRVKKGGMKLGASGHYALDVGHKHAALKNLEKAHAAGKVLLDIAHRAPKSGSDWIRLQSRAMPALKKMGFPGLSMGGYNAAWSMRCALVAGHTIKNIQRMDINNPSLKNFARMFPDQAAGVFRVARAVGQRTVADLIKKLQYRGPPQFLSMDLCLIGALEKFDPQRIMENSAFLKHLMKKCRKDRHMWPVPVELLAEASRRGVDCRGA